ncbi:MAG TPA: LD-carboxypeptidase [Roseivirga sp.]
MALPKLNAGDKVAVIATAKKLERSIEAGIQILESWGLEVVHGSHLHDASEYFSATDAKRLTDLQMMLDDSEIRAIIFARGGYGTTKILDLLDFRQFKSSPKWTVGFSDLTSFLLQCGRFKQPAIHGPMVYTLGQDSNSDELLRSILFGERQFQFDLRECPSTREGKVDSEITGGNLSLIYESIGATNEIQTAGKILFLEEIGEDYYAIDRMMNKLKRIGKLAELKGAIIGDFTNVKDGSGYFTRTLEDILYAYFKDIDGPIAFGFPGGHEAQNMPLIFHQPVSMAVNQRQISLSYLDNKAS